MNRALANILSENGRPGKLLIPPSTTRVCEYKLELPTVYLQEMRHEIYIPSSLAKHGLLLVRTQPYVHLEYNQLYLYNGGWENQWIEHGDAIAEIWEFSRG